MTSEDRTATGAMARGVMRGVDRVALATAQRDEAGWPHPSLAMVALDLDGTPILLLSTLAEHTRNLTRDDRVGLLFDGTVGLDEPLAAARVSVLGRAHRAESERLRRRYLARHPSAAVFAGFGDFAIYQVMVERAHLVAGFGRIHRLDATDLPLPADALGTLAEDEPALLETFNGAYAGSGWTVTGVDPEGCDLRRGGAVARLAFESRATDAETARAAFRRVAPPGGAGPT